MLVFGLVVVFEYNIPTIGHCNRPSHDIVERGTNYRSELDQMSRPHWYSHLSQPVKTVLLNKQETPGFEPINPSQTHQEDVLRMFTQSCV